MSGIREDRGSRVHRRTVATLALLIGGVVAIVASTLVAVTLGPMDLTVGQAWGIVGQQLGLTGPADGISALQEATVWKLRMPRALLAALSGAALAICGAILQSLLRNQLADPFILGISSGASTGAVVVIVLGIGTAVGLTGGAFIGAIAAFALTLLLARFAGRTSDKIILAGVAATQLFSALTSLVVMLSANADTTRSVMYWLLGSLSSSSWKEVGYTAVILVLGMALAVGFSGHLDALAFGEDAASSLGVNVRLLRIILLGATALLTAVVVSASGAIGFVGLVVPHIARMLVGPLHRHFVPVSAIIGAVLLIWVDALARTIAEPQEIPVGVFTAIVGVPIFVMVLVRSGRRS